MDIVDVKDMSLHEICLLIQYHPSSNILYLIGIYKMPEHVKQHIARICEAWNLEFLETDYYIKICEYDTPTIAVLIEDI